MEDFSESSDEENTHPLTKPNRKTRTTAQQDAFKKAQHVRVENAKIKKTRLEEIKETIKLETEAAKQERENEGLTKLQQQRKDIETKILSEVKAMKEKKQEAANKRQARKDELRAKEKAKDDLKALEKASKLEEPVEPDEPAPTTLIATLKKPKKEPKIIYESESEEEVVIIKKKKKPPKIIYQDATDDEAEDKLNKSVSKKSAPIIEKQPQIIKTNQIRFF